MKPRTWRRASAALLAMLLGSILALLVGELTVRLLGLEDRYLEAIIPVQAADVEVHEEDPNPDLLYRLKAGVEFIEKPLNDGTPFLSV